MGAEPRKVIIITDGDDVARQAVESVAMQIGGRCISRSAGNPTPLGGSQLVELIKQAATDPVLVMFDDNGNYDRGLGEQAIEYVLLHPDIEVLGVIAVASNTRYVRGTRVQYSVDKNGNIVEDAVDKDGNPVKQLDNRIYGDTVDILNKYRIPWVIGIGDIGKMEGKDSPRRGCPVTRKAVEWILERSGWRGRETANVREQNGGEAPSDLERPG